MKILFVIKICNLMKIQKCKTFLWMLELELVDEKYQLCIKTIKVNREKIQKNTMVEKQV